MATNFIDKQLASDGVSVQEDAPEDTAPSYRVLGDSKIPVSKKMGVLWSSRKDQGLSARGDAQSRWDEAIKYYENDQSSTRSKGDNRSGNTVYANRLNNQWTETENVVFANASIMVPMLYGKNPTISVTAENEAHEDTCEAVQKLGNKLIAMKTAPGLGLKAKMRRTILLALLTNRGVVKINWTDKQNSSEQAINELATLTEELVAAKTTKEIRIAEGKIAALEETVNLLSPAGPKLTVRNPHHIVVDPTIQEADGTDAQWMMEWDFLPTDYINAVYGKSKDGKIVSVYDPTHVLMAGETNNQGVQDEVDNFKLIPENGAGDAAAYGYKTSEQLKAASMTKVWWVWDKTTRRVYMFADNNWTWPIWVWDDPLKLPRFFPYFFLAFHEGTNPLNSKGEVVYYLDQQDAINEINDETRRGRYWAKRNVFFNENLISTEDVEAVLKGPDGTARGIKLEEGSTLNDAIMSLTPPSLKFPELFSTDSKFAAINRITGINDSMRGAQFKTNTTNKAVDAYQSNVDIRVDERVDLIEDFVADIMWNISMLCMMKWEATDVVDLIGEEQAKGWIKVSDNRQFDTMMSLRVEAGSVGKPNSREMKQQAMQLGQVLGQFANASPYVIVLMMKMFEKAFEGQVIISDEDWDNVIRTMEMSLTKAGGGPGDQGGQGQEPPADPNAQPAQNDEQLKEQVKAKIQALPPQAQAMLKNLVDKGTPPAEALKQVEQQVQDATK